MSRPLFNPKKIEILAKTNEGWGKAWDALQNPLFNEAYLRLRHGDLSLVDVVIQFLEEDPYFFRSGYWKQQVLQMLKKHDLPEGALVRLRRVCLMVVDKCDRRGFRSYCRLARRIADDAFRQDLADRTYWPSSEISRRARWMLDAVNGSPRQ